MQTNYISFPITLNNVTFCSLPYIELSILKKLAYLETYYLIFMQGFRIYKFLINTL